MKNTREHDKKWIETLQERNRVLNELLQLTQIENEELKEQLTLTDVVKSDSEQFTPFKEAKGMCSKCLRHWCICEKQKD